LRRASPRQKVLQGKASKIFANLFYVVKINFKRYISDWVQKFREKSQY